MVDLRSNIVASFPTQSECQITIVREMHCMEETDAGKYGTPRKKLLGATFFGSQMRYRIVKDYPR